LILDSGFHKISISFYENAYYDGIELWWLKPGSGPSDIPYYGTNFHGTPPTFNPNTNWELVPKLVLFTSIDSITPIKNPEPRKQLPVKFQVFQNYPNPFNPSTVISWQLAVSSPVKLAVYNLTGQKVATLVNEILPAGHHSSEWHASKFGSGVYLYHLEAEGIQQTRKMILLK
jgi:hypothetical protein